MRPSTRYSKTISCELTKWPRPRRLEWDRTSKRALNDFVGAALAPDLIAAIPVENQRRTLAGRGLPLQFETHALIIAVETLLLGFCRGNQGKSGDQKTDAIGRAGKIRTKRISPFIRLARQGLRRQRIPRGANRLPSRSSEGLSESGASVPVRPSLTFI